MIYINNPSKLDKIKLTKNNFYIVSDFDQTMTGGNTPGSWKIDKENSENLLKERNELYDTYRPIEIDNTIDKDEKFKLMKQWYEETLKLLVKYNIKESEIDTTVRKWKI